MSWLTLTLISAFSLATADMLTKKYLGSYRARELVLVRFGLTGLLLLPWVLVQPWPVLPTPFWGWMAIAIPLEIFAMLLYAMAIRDCPLGLTLPYLAFTPVFTIVTGSLVLDEQISTQGFSGIGLVVIGAWWLNVGHVRKSRHKLAWLAPFSAIVRERGSRLMLSAAALYSLTSVISKAALLYTEPLFFGPFYFVAIGVASILFFGAREPGSIRALWRKPIANLLVAIAMGTMVVSHFLAIENVEVAYMIAAKRSSLLFGILYGAIVFGERRSVSHFLAGLLMIAGITLMTSQ